MALPHNIRSAALALLGVVVLSLSACIDPQVGVRRTGSASSVSVPRNSSNVTDTANQHIVKKGDTLYAIAFRYELDYRDIARWNGITEPFIIKPDQRLILRDPNSVPALAQSNGAPVPTNSATPQTQTSSVTSTAPTAQVGVEAPMTQGVSVGSTVPESQLSTVEPLSPTNAEGLPTGFAGNSPAPVRPGTPTAANAAGTPSAGAPATATAPPVSTSAQADVPVTPPAELMAPKPDTAMAIQAPTLGTGTKPSGVKPPAGANGWGWPVIGRVLTTFSGTDPGRQGVDISGNLGDPVHAAKGGDVVYSGRGIIGYGELIVIKHDDSTLTAYGHNDKRSVKEGQRVTQGQKIAEMGKAPNGQSLLHFEVRRNGKPIDPLSVLPARR